MAGSQMRGSTIDADRVTRQSRPAGLYGELPPLPVSFPADRRHPAVSRKPRRTADPAS